MTATDLTTGVIEGVGLVTGQPSRVTLTPAPAGHGVVFQLNGVSIPARPESVADANRGVTLCDPASGQVLVLVEHFLAACGMTGLTDWQVDIQGAPELPILDGSSIDWLRAITSFNLTPTPKAIVPLTAPVYYEHPGKPGITCLALPATELKITYSVDFPHPDLEKRWLSIDAASVDWAADIAQARTFGFVSELPKLQEMGLAKGVSLENTLGLTDDGGYTTPLRMPDECIRHKILDFIGDMTLCGIPVRDMSAHFVLTKSGHAAHIGFGHALRAALTEA